jgi:ferredoxin
VEIRFDEAKCVAAGQCVQAAPGVFDQDDDGTVMLIAGDHEDDIEAIKRAIRVCPTRVISLAE